MGNFPRIIVLFLRFLKQRIQVWHIFDHINLLHAKLQFDHEKVKIKIKFKRTKSLLIKLV